MRRPRIAVAAALLRLTGGVGLGDRKCQGASRDGKNTQKKEKRTS